MTSGSPGGSTRPDQSAASTPPTEDAPARRQRARLVAAAVLGALFALFAVLNSQSVRVHWLVTTTSLPLIVVIVVGALIGALVCGLITWRRRRQS
jgi:uncharacterized integral membrane protein